MSNTEGIPIRRLVVHDPKDMPLHYGETPGGSIFSTTPGGKPRRAAQVHTSGLCPCVGTRIYYDRAFLLSRRDSPMTRSPPHLPFIPEGECRTRSLARECMLPFAVTLIPEPEKGGDLHENGLKTDKKDRTGSSAEKSSVDQQRPTAATSGKKGT